MDRINLADGRWFDRSTADKWEEDRRFDGNNMISVATGSQWEHEELYRTRSGRWILHYWSQWQGGRDTYRAVADATAHQWLMSNGYHEDVPEDVLASAEV